MKTDYDGARKRALTRFLPHAFRLLFPHAHARIDWKRGLAFLDKELERVARDTRFPKLRVDKLVRVYFAGGGSVWILIHIEVQSQRDANFELRMYVYNCRLFELHGKPVASYAVLADDTESWRPNRYERDTIDTHVEMRFPTVKLKDFESRIDELEKSDNPFALVVLAHLQTRASHNDEERRLEFKRRLYRLAYRSGYSKSDILELLLVIDWLMVLPDTLESRLEPEIKALEKEKPVEFMNYWERRGVQKGALDSWRQSVLEALRAHFGSVPRGVRQSVAHIDDVSVLMAIHKSAVKCPSIEDFKRTLKK